MPDLKKMLTLEALSEALPSWLKRSTKPEYNADEIDSTLTTNQFVTASDKDNWNAKGTYSKPSGGIPKSDLSSIVQTSLEKADSALQSETDPTVPSWAKQSSKPSYTQDEVSDGSTYKRVTQTEKDAWSGKQNALTTTQMQAVNSGITSAGVAQISTNQTNILSVDEWTGKKNNLTYEMYNVYSTFNWRNPVRTSNGVTFALNNDGSVSLSGTATGNVTNIIAQFTPNTDMAIGNFTGYKLSGGYSSDIKLCIELSVSPYIKLATDTGSGATIGAPTQPNSIHSLFIEISSGTNVNGIIIRPMICTPEAWEHSHTWEGLALQNTAITPELIELCDSGAKNLLDVSQATFGNKSKVTFNADGSVTGNITDDARIWGWDAREFTFTLPAGTYCMHVDVTGGSNNNWGIQLRDSSNNTYGYVSPYVGTTTYFTLTTSKTLGFIGKIFDRTLYIMLCTGAAFNVSQKFVPHRYDPYTTVYQNVRNATLYARRNGRTVTVNGYVDNVSFTAGANTTLGTINDEIGKPLQQVRSICSVGANAYTFGEPAYLTITTDGNVVVKTNTYSGTGAVFFSVSYTI